MTGFGGDNLYELELYVPDPALATMPDSGGMDTISALYAHDELVEIDLSFRLDSSGAASCAMARYFGGRFAIWHQLIIYGVVEHAIGSPGRDRITGNELANRLSGEGDLAGPGGADTIHGGAGNDTVLGGGGADVLSGGDGDDSLAGGAENDLIFGGLGRDTVLGGAGADTLDGGYQAGDQLSYAGSAERVNLRIAVSGFATVSGGDAEGDLVQGFRDLRGSDFADVLVDNDKLDLAAGANANAFFGGLGADILFLGGGADTGMGGLGNDTLRGEIGADVLYGGAGLDRLIGGPGADMLWGGAGADRFQFLLRGDSPAVTGQMDQIGDFKSTEADLIDLSEIDANILTADNQAFQLSLSGPTGQAGQVWLQPQGGDLLLLADLNGDSIADFAVLLLGLTSLGAGSLVL